MRKVCKIKFLKTKLNKNKLVSSRKIIKKPNKTKLGRKNKVTVMSEGSQPSSETQGQLTDPGSPRLARNLKVIDSFQSRDCPLFLISSFIETKVTFKFFNQTEKYGYTSVISLFNSLRQFKDMRIYLISPEEIVFP